MPDIYDNISPVADTPEVASVDHIARQDLSVKKTPIYNPFATSGTNGVGAADTGNDLDKLINATDKSLAAQPWAKAEVYGSPILNTPFNLTSRYLDPKLGFDATDKDLEVKYGANQGIVDRVFNRLVKTGATAAVSFGEGLASAINLMTGTSNVDNKGISEANDWLEKLDSGEKTLAGMNLANYQTEYQRDHPLLSYLPNPFELKSFLDNAGKITQNLGYTIGAMASAAVMDIPIAAVTEGIGEIPLLAKQSSKIFSSIGKMSRMLTGSAEEFKAYQTALQSGDDVLKALSRSSDITRGFNTARFINSSVLSAYGESVVEGNGIYRETKKKLQEPYTDIYGNYTGDAETTQRIEAAAKDAGQTGLRANMAFLSVSNMFGLGSILRPGAAAIKATEKSLAEEVSVRLAKNNINLFEVVPNEVKGISGILKKLAKPTSLIGSNLKEAVEEGYQTGIQTGTESYYTRKFNARANNDANALSESINDAFHGVFATTEGQESMLMGLLGGIIQGGAQGIIQGRQGIKRGSALAEDIVKNLNRDTVTSLFNTTRNEAVTGADLIKEMQDAAKSGDMFKYKNLQHQQLFNFVDSGVRANKFDARIEQLNSLKNLSKENFETLFNIDLNSDNQKTVGQYVDGIIDKANEIKSEIDKVNTVFGSNPYSAKNQPTNHAIFENYKSELGLALSEQKDHIRRVKTLKDSLSANLPLATYQPLIDLASETGIQNTLTTFNKRISDLKQNENLAKSEPLLSKGMKEEREFLEIKVKQIEDAISNNETYDKYFLGVVNSLHNYYANGNSLYGDNHVSRVDSVALFNRSVDINKLTENTKRIQRYYEELTGQKGFQNFAQDFGRRIEDFADRIRIDENGKMRVLTDEEIDAENPVSTTADNKEYIDKNLGVASVEEGNDKIDKEDKDLIAKLIDPDEHTEEGDISAAEKIRNGTTPITQEMKDTAKSRLEAEFADATETPIVTPENATKAQVREAKIKKAAEQKGVNVVNEEEDNSDINSIMEEDLNNKKTSPQTVVTPDIPVETPTEIISNPIVRFWNKFIFSPLKELNRVFTFDNDKDAKFRTNLDKLILGNMKPELMHKNVISKLTLEVVKSTKGKTPDQRSKIVYFDNKGVKQEFDNLYRAGYSVDVNVMVGDSQVGLLQPPTSLQFKRGDEFFTLDKLRDAAEYSSVTKNPANTFDQFQKDFKEYSDAYNEAIKGFNSGEMLHVNNASVLKLFKPVISYGGIDYANKVDHSTLIKDLKYRGKGDAILSFPMELNPENGRYERTSTPNILNADQLNEDQIAETLAYVGGNIAKIHAQDVRYIYLMRMPDGEFGNQSVIVARPDDEAAPDLENYLAQLKAALSNPESRSYFEINKELGEAVYIAHYRKTGNQLIRKTNARFSVQRNEKKDRNSIVLNISNKGLSYNSKIEFSQEEIFGLKNFNDFIKLANTKIIEKEKNDRYLRDKIDLRLTTASFKKSITNDEDVSTEDLENKLRVSVRPKVFSNSSITMMPANGEAYVPPTDGKKRGKKPTPPSTNSPEIRTTGEGVTTGPVKTSEPAVTTPTTIDHKENQKNVGKPHTTIRGMKDGKRATIIQGIVNGKNNEHINATLSYDNYAGGMSGNFTRSELTKYAKDLELADTVSKPIAAVHVGQVYIDPTGKEQTVIKISDKDGKSYTEIVDKDKNVSTPTTDDFLSNHKLKEAEAAPTSNTSTKPTAPTIAQRDYAEEVVNKNLNNIINQLKAKGLLKTDC